MKAKGLVFTIVGALLLAWSSYAQQQFGGIGLVVGVHHDAVTVIHVVTNTPAFKAGLAEGLVIQRIDGTPTQGKPLKDCVEMLRGEPGSKVKLELVDPVQSTTNTVELTREAIALPPTSGSPPPSKK